MKEITNRQLEIIEAAGKILTASGVGGLTIKNLAKEMNFSESAIYRHFSSKQDIIIAMLEYLAKNMDERYGVAISENQTVEEKFINLFTSQFTFFKSNPYFVVAVFSDGLMEESQKVNDAIHKIMTVKMKHLKPIIMQGQKDDIFTNEISVEELLNVVMGSFRLFMFKWRIADFNYDIEEPGHKLIQTLLKLLKKK
ncbi:MAG: TetR/AcrR family transcriptional regulator [Bacteroidetes bacterium]|nr:MAG: TetR/AcrR family transcriptional regulator [Bacteroidota bacterium]